MDTNKGEGVWSQQGRGRHPHYLGRDGRWFLQGLGGGLQFPDWEAGWVVSALGAVVRAEGKAHAKGLWK